MLLKVCAPLWYRNEYRIIRVVEIEMWRARNSRVRWIIHRFPEGCLVGRRADNLHVLHHSAILVAQDVAVQHELSGNLSA